MTRQAYDTVSVDAVATVDKPGGPLRRFAEVLRGAMQGKLNIGGSVALSGTTTMLNDVRIGGQSVILFQANDAAGVALVPTIWISARGKGVAVINHGSGTATLDYVVIG